MCPVEKPAPNLLHILQCLTINQDRFKAQTTQQLPGTTPAKRCAIRGHTLIFNSSSSVLSLDSNAPYTVKAKLLQSPEGKLHSDCRRTLYWRLNLTYPAVFTLFFFCAVHLLSPLCKNQELSGYMFQANIMLRDEPCLYKMGIDNSECVQECPHL